MAGRTAGADATMETPVRLKSVITSESCSPDSVLQFDCLELEERVSDSRRAPHVNHPSATVEMLRNVAFVMETNFGNAAWAIVCDYAGSSDQVSVIFVDDETSIIPVLSLVDSGKYSSMIPGKIYNDEDMVEEPREDFLFFETWVEIHSVKDVLKGILCGEETPIWDIRGVYSSDESYRATFLQTLSTSVVLTDPIDLKPPAEKDSYRPLAAAKPTEINSAFKTNKNEALTFPTSVSQLELQAEFSDHTEPPVDALVTKSPVIDPESPTKPPFAKPKPPTKPPVIDLELFSIKPPFIEPELPTKQSVVIFEPKAAIAAEPAETSSATDCFGQVPPELTCWNDDTFEPKPRAKPPDIVPTVEPPTEPPDGAFEPKPRVKPPDIAPKLKPPTEPADPNSNMEAFLPVYVFIDQNHKVVFSGA